MNTEATELMETEHAFLQAEWSRGSQGTFKRIEVTVFITIVHSTHCKALCSDSSVGRALRLAHARCDACTKQ